MSLNYHPKAGEILLCDFPRRDASLHEGDLMQGEMDKLRLAIVLNGKLEGRSNLVNVVPISMTAPAVLRPWHVLVPNRFLPPNVVKARPDARYAKCDMVATVSLERLNWYLGHWNSRRDRMQKKRIVEKGKLDAPTLEQVRRAVARALGCERLLIAERDAGIASARSVAQPSENVIELSVDKMRAHR